MATGSDWGEGTIGESASEGRTRQTQAELGRQFPGAKLSAKTHTPEAREQMAENIVRTTLSATPEEMRAGRRWYSDAHRDAVHLAQGIDPESRQAQLHTRARYTPPVKDPRAVAREAGNISALSPAMDWGKNVLAAKEVHDLTPEHVSAMRQNVADISKAAQTRRALNKVNKSGVDDGGAAYDAHRQATAAKEESRAAARGPLAGKALNSQSTVNILKAHDIHTGAIEPEEAFNVGKPGQGQYLKTGNFFHTINNPRDPDSTTIDTRSADIGMGVRHPWKTPRGLQSPATYDVHVGAHHEARDMLRPMGFKYAHQVQATSWLADKRAATVVTGGKHRVGEDISAVHRGALQEPPNQPGPAAKKMTGINTIGRNRHGDDL